MKRKVLWGLYISVTFYETKPFFSGFFPWNPGDVHINGHERRDVTLGAARLGGVTGKGGDYHERLHSRHRSLAPVR